MSAQEFDKSNELYSVLKLSGDSKLVRSIVTNVFSDEGEIVLHSDYLKGLKFNDVSPIILNLKKYGMVKEDPFFMDLDDDCHVTRYTFNEDYKEAFQKLKKDLV